MKIMGRTSARSSTGNAAVVLAYVDVLPNIQRVTG